MVVSRRSHFRCAYKGSFIRDGGGQGLKGSLPVLELETFSKVPFNLETLNSFYSCSYSCCCRFDRIINDLKPIDDLTETSEGMGIENVCSWCQHNMWFLVGGAMIDNLSLTLKVVVEEDFQVLYVLLLAFICLLQSH